MSLSWLVAERNQRAFTWAYDAVGLPGLLDIEPRATGHIPEMIVLIRRLIEARPRSVNQSRS